MHDLIILSSVMARTSPATVPDGTLQSVFDYLMPSVARERKKLKNVVEWPPDVFAAVALILHKTGAYRAAVVESMWPKGYAHTTNHFEGLGRQWRDAIKGAKPMPREICALWDRVLDQRALLLNEVSGESRVVATLMNLLTACDVACDGMGLPQPGAEDDEALIRAAGNLAQSYLYHGASTLCECVVPSAVCVLPKLHTPQIGLTIRSLTHHLALWPRDEIAPLWAVEVASKMTSREQGGLNILLVPHPPSIERKQFKSLKTRRCGRHDMSASMSFFSYETPTSKKWIQEKFGDLIESALRSAPDQRIDAVVFPELSLRGSAELEAAVEVVLKKCKTAFVVAGVQEREVVRGKVKCTNTAQVVVPLPSKDSSRPLVWMFRQDKHHRWQLDGSQIKRYKLQDQLDAGTVYWEDTELADRTVEFFPLKRSLTTCVLVCEDLARQEPAARLLRAVGPSLVIALLMDGEQTHSRWSGRYAAVLGEDPGSSVLTLTSKGMIDLDNGGSSKKKKSSDRRCIALWRDAKHPTIREIPLEHDAEAVIMNVKCEDRSELSADGRSYMTPTLFLEPGPKGVIQVKIS